MEKDILPGNKEAVSLLFITLRESTPGREYIVLIIDNPDPIFLIILNNTLFLLAIFGGLSLPIQLTGL